MFNLYRAFLEGLQDIPDIIKYWYLILTEDADETSTDMFWWLISWNVDNNYKPVWWISQEYINWAKKTLAKPEHKEVSSAKLEDVAAWWYSEEENGYIH